MKRSHTLFVLFDALAHPNPLANGTDRKRSPEPSADATSISPSHGRSPPDRTTFPRSVLRMSTSHLLMPHICEDGCVCVFLRSRFMRRRRNTLHAACLRHLQAVGVPKAPARLAGAARLASVRFCSGLQHVPLCSKQHEHSLRISQTPSTQWMIYLGLQAFLKI